MPVIIFMTFLGGLSVGLSYHYYWGANQNQPDPSPKALRMDGYTYISPLLLCDAENANSSPQLTELNTQLQQLIDEKIESQELAAASIYYRDLKSNSSVFINPEEKFYPASLNKIPVMIAAYKMAETNPAFLLQEVTYTGRDENTFQPIPPADAVTPGQTITIAAAIEKMIRYSDNNAFYLLAQHINPEVFKATYTDLKIPIRQDEYTSPDFINAENFSYFLRTLYNATYLNKEYSEMALKTLAQVKYDTGLAAGLPGYINLANKYGVYALATPPVNELHDCGIVYRPDRPYLLCVMTKSRQSLSVLEQFISQVSGLVFTAAY